MRLPNSRRIGWVRESRHSRNRSDPARGLPGSRARVHPAEVRTTPRSELPSGPASATLRGNRHTPALQWRNQQAASKHPVNFGQITHTAIFVEKELQYAIAEIVAESARLLECRVVIRVAVPKFIQMLAR